MTSTVTLPWWLFICILAFAAVTLASHFLFPSVRWFFRLRMERAVARLNARLERPIEPFKLARRHDMIQRLIYDTKVSQAIAKYAKDQGVPENVAFERATRYAREIVPSFSATAYFSIAMRFAKWLAQSLYHVRVQYMDSEGLKHIDPEAAVVYVMNHRSNMDYFLVTWLASDRTAMSYAVGEWAQVWPLSRVIRAMGAYFIRRQDSNDLYRRVLARYVQMATDAGVTQAIFLEGRLSLTGALCSPKMGLLKYIAEDRDVTAKDVVFVPVAINYDRVFEDRPLIEASKSGQRRFPARIGVITYFGLRKLWHRLIRRPQYEGYAAVNFGSPLSLAEFQAQGAGRSLDALADELMTRIGQGMPMPPIALLSHILLRTGPVTKAELEAEVAQTTTALAPAQAHLLEGPEDSVTKHAIAQMIRRNMIREVNGKISMQDEDLLNYYAASIKHLFADAA